MRTARAARTVAGMNTDTQYVADVTNVDIQDGNQIENDLTSERKDSDLGSYFSKNVKKGDQFVTVAERLKVRIKSTQGSIVAIDAASKGGNKGMKATMTLVLRGKDADGLKLKDLRGVATKCTYDFE